MHRLKKLHLDIPTIAYLIVFVLTALATLAEGLMYAGFVAKRSHVNIEVIVGVFLISTFLYAGSRVYAMRKEGSKTRESSSDYPVIYQKLYRVSKTFTISILVLWLLLFFAEMLMYDNFVYSKLHFNLHTFPFFIFVNIVFAYVWYVLCDIESMKVQRLIVKTSMLVFVGYMVFTFVTLTSPQVGTKFAYMIRHPLASHEEKTAHDWGKPITSYISLLKEKVPNGVTTLIPSRTWLWAVEGNQSLMTGFLYPRILVNDQEVIKNVTKQYPQVRYIALSRGLWSYNKSPADWENSSKFFTLDDTLIGRVKAVYVFDLANTSAKKVYERKDQSDTVPDISNIQYGLIELSPLP